MTFAVQVPFLLFDACLLVGLYRVNRGGVLFMHGAYFFLSVVAFLLVMPLSLDGARSHGLTIVASHIVCSWYLAAVVLSAIGMRSFDWTIPRLASQPSYLILMALSVLSFILKAKFRLEYTGFASGGFDIVSAPLSLSIPIQLLNCIEIGIVVTLLWRLYSAGMTPLGIVALAVALVPFVVPGFVEFGTRRAIALVVVVALPLIAKNGRLSGARAVVAIIAAFALATGYQRVRGNLVNPEVFGALTSQNPTEQARGLVLFFTTTADPGRAIQYRATSADYLYDVVDQYIHRGSTTKGAIVADAIAWAIPGFLFDKKHLLGSDRIVASRLRLEGPGVSLSNRADLDYSNSLLADLIADLGALGAALAPLLLVALIAMSMSVLRRASPYGTVVYVAVLTNLILAIGLTEQSVSSYAVAVRFNVLIATLLVVSRLVIRTPLQRPSATTSVQLGTLESRAPTT